MQQALVANFDIAAAVARIVEADAQARIVGAALLPSITGTADVQRSQSSRAGLGTSSSTGGGGTTQTSGSRNSAQNFYMTALNASYTLDFWGHNRALLRAAEYLAVGSRFDREVVAITTLATLADTYFLVF